MWPGVREFVEARRSIWHAPRECNPLATGAGGSEDPPLRIEQAGLKTRLYGTAAGGTRRRVACSKA
jgi:hypothetical protein